MISFHVITDHQPFVSLLSSNINLDLLSHPTFSYAFDAIHVHERPCTKNESHYSRRPVAHSTRTTSDRGRSSLDGRSEATSKPSCGVRYLQQRSAFECRARQLDDDVCRQVMRYCADGWHSHPYLPSVLRPD